jgi:Spy/CpxP family protein refolding chaperone
VNKLAKLLPLLSIVLTIPTIAQVAHANPHHHHGQIADVRMGGGDKLTLTAEQKTKMEQLRQSANKQIEQILTPEQLPKFRQIESQHQARKQTHEGFNLTADQKAKIKAIHQANRQQFNAILTPAQQAQIKQDRETGDHSGWVDRLKRLNFTPEQKTKLEQLKTNTEAQMGAVLTPEQRQKAQTMKAERGGMKNDWQSINLTADQKAKIKAIHQANHEKFKAILTPEQRSKFEPGQHKGGHHPM